MTRYLFAFLLYACCASAHAALDAQQVRRLAAEDSSDKVAAIEQLTQTADPDAVRVLKAMADDSLFLAGDRVVIVDGEQAFDAATGRAIALPENPESIYR
jgi:urea transport system permease protein